MSGIMSFYDRAISKAFAIGVLVVATLLTGAFFAPWVNMGTRIGLVYNRFEISGLNMVIGVGGVGFPYLLILIAFPIAVIVFALLKQPKGILASAIGALVGAVALRLVFESLTTNVLRANIATFRYLIYLEFTVFFMAKIVVSVILLGGAITLFVLTKDKVISSTSQSPNTSPERDYSWEGSSCSSHGASKKSTGNFTFDGRQAFWGLAGVLVLYVAVGLAMLFYDIVFMRGMPVLFWVDIMMEYGLQFATTRIISMTQNYILIAIAVACFVLSGFQAIGQRFSIPYGLLGALVTGVLGVLLGSVGIQIRELVDVTMMIAPVLMVGAAAFGFIWNAITVARWKFNLPRAFLGLFAGFLCGIRDGFLCILSGWWAALVILIASAMFTWYIGAVALVIAGLFLTIMTIRGYVLFGRGRDWSDLDIL